MSETTPSAIDRLIAIDCPVVTMPRVGQLQKMESSGHRLVVAADGLYKEVKRPWLHAMVKMAPCSTPYGYASTKVRVVQHVPADLLSQFQALALAAAPLEIAAWIVWDERTGAMRLQLLKEISVSPVHVEFERPCLESFEHTVVDIHSHHSMAPTFSAQDDADDRANAGTYIAGVIGHIQTNPTWNFRLVLDGQPADFSVQNLEIGGFQ